MSIRFEAKKQFRVGREIVFQGLLDLEAASRWMQGLVGIERLDEGRLQVGSQWKETRKMFGKQASELFEVVELREPEKIVLRCDGTKGTTGKGEYLFTYVLSQANGETVVTLYGEISGLSGPAKWFGKLIAGTFRKACARDLDALQRYLEQQGGPSR